ncbi:DUF2971 domain-containing protein [Fusibacter ferrireducens]|uniref:DUF2971 domain-containing protein n=1 Tax=Fusibacter ferrireducens TaxID=2785058 RepID=A0ABS0A2I0_9FIRM|nr:DUF2971 domain-containing protein [Fusibacter ferrireducens]MBF4696094.1 DUF2971 domain-containing protein [Fusibacter ferrireducens]
MNIYHYTSIKNLALILESKKMKFTRLDNVNDPYDGTVNDYESSQKLVYVSCFTKREDDSLPMWSMYTNNMNGVRIKFGHNLFGEIENKFWNGTAARERTINYFGGDENTVIFGPILIEYKSNVNDIQCSIISEGPGLKLFDPLRIGLYKLDDWSFEEEVRYKILSFNAMIGGPREGSVFEEKMEQVKEYIYEDIKWILVDLYEPALKKAEILLGPKVDEADEIIIRALVEKYLPSIKVTKSEKKVV